MAGAGIIHRCVRISEGKSPFCAYADNESFKIYMLDTGLLCARFDLAADYILTKDPHMDNFKGAFTENYVMQALTVQEIKPYYWSQPQKAELDFVFQTPKGTVIPLECQLSENVRSKSLHTFMNRYDCPYGICVSTRNFGYENKIKSVPPYALYCLLL